MMYQKRYSLFLRTLNWFDGNYNESYWITTLGALKSLYHINFVNSSQKFREKKNYEQKFIYIDYINRNEG